MPNSSIRAFAGMKAGNETCEDIIKCVLELDDADWKVYYYLLENGPVKVDDIASFLERNRSTAQRELQKLVKCGICIKESKTIEKGGYFFVYSAQTIEKMTREIEFSIDETYIHLKQILLKRSNPMRKEEG